MKRYKVTDKHELLKEGVEIYLRDDLWCTKTPQSMMNIPQNIFDEWKDDGWIVKIKKCKWTYLDLIGFGLEIRESSNVSVVDILEEYIQRGHKKSID